MNKLPKKKIEIFTENSMHKSFQFLSGGGEMGALMRAFNWDSSPMGNVANWPQSLLTTLGILLNSKFPMFLFWGEHHICFYNDAYRPSLGKEGKHPIILGMKGKDAWSEIWQTINPLIEQVLKDGEATWSEDQLIPIYRNGEIEDVYWTFSYSPVKGENGMPAGVFVTCNETTDKVNNSKRLTDSNNQLQFAIEATQLGTWDYNPTTKKFIGNNRIKDWFGIPYEEDFDIAEGMKVIAEKDRSSFCQTIQRALEYESGGVYDFEFSLVNPLTKNERVVHVKGKAYFGEDKKPFRFNGTLQDITQVSFARKKIEESEERFRNLIWQAPVLIATYRGPSFIVETINQSVVETWGKNYEDIINKPLFEVSPELEEWLKTMLNEIYTTGEPFINNEIEVQIKRPGKPDKAYFNLLYQPLRDVYNNIYAIMLIGTEVTENVNARKEIEANEKRFSNILSQSMLAIGILKGSDFILDFANETMLSTWRRGSEVIGKRIIEIMPEIKEQAFYENLLQVYRDGLPYHGYEIKTFNLKNGIPLERYYNFVFQPYIEVDNSIVGITFFATEVTEQVLAKKRVLESEAKFRVLSESIPNMIWTATPDGKKNFFNQYFLDYTGLTFEDLKGDGWHKIIFPEDLKNELKFWHPTIAAGQDLIIEKRIRHKDGTYRWHLCHSIAQLDKQGKILGWIGTNTEIEEQKIKEKKKDEFISIASHEMKTPLTIAKAYLQLLEMNLEEENKDLKLYTTKANEAIERLNSLITELLDVSKIQEGKINYNFSEFNFNELVDNTVDEIQLSSLKHKLIKTGKLDGFVIGDKNRLQQVIINLLSNAIKYSPDAKEVYIHIENKNGEVNVSIMDRGLGINKQHLQKIFERYYSVDEHAILYQGLGIGLYISEEIILRHKGKIWVESEEGKGSTFYFTIPL